MKFLSKVKLSNRRYKTPEGYLVCVDSIIARTGKQEYLKSEIFQDSNDDSVIQIDRPKSEVLSPSTIASFENKPLVDEHPDEDVNVDNYRDYAIGFARDVRGSKLDDTDILIANLIFTDPEAIAEIESGEKTELSCGYDCDILGEGDNLYQANIRGNHIALCKAGRAGIARIQDSSSKEIREVVNNRYSEKLKDLSPEERIKKIDELIADEEEAIVGYKEAMKYANEADKSIYAHIIAEELEHITELKTLRAENFEKNNINDAGTTRRMFRESEIGDENSWFGTTDWGTPKGNMYIYRKNGKIIAEGVYNDWYNDLQKGEKKEFNSVKELNKWLNTFTEDSNIKDTEKKEFTYINNKKFFEDEENKKMRDGALKGIHLKKIRNTLRNEDEDLVEDFLDYMDTRPDLVKEYDDYSDYMVREDFETWKKYKKIKTRDVDTYEEVTEDLEKELRDSDTLKNLAYKFAQMGNYFDRAHSANSRKILGKEDDEKISEFYNLGLQVYKQLEQEVDYLKNNKRTNSNRDYGFLSETVGLLEDGANGLNKIKDEKCKLLSKKINDLLYEYKKHTYKDSKVKDSKKYTITYRLIINGHYLSKGTYGVNHLEEFDKFLDKSGISSDSIFIDSVTSKNGLDFDGHLRKWTDVKKDLEKELRDSKIKDKLENKPINILIKFDSSKEANDALKSLQRKEKFMNSKLVANDTIKVMTTDVDYEELKNILKLYFIKNIKTIDSKVNNSEKLLNIIKLYKKVTKDSKLKDTHFTVSSNRNSEEFNSEEELLKKYKIEGYDTVRGIKAPKLKGLMGPFFNGNGKILYETNERYGSYDSCKDSKLKDSYVEEWWGQTNEEEPKILAKRYGLTVVALKRNMDETLYRFYGPTKNIEKAMKDGYFYNPERYVKDEKKIIKKASDSKLKDVNYEKIVEKVLDENEIYLDDVDYVEDTNRGVEILCTSYYAQLKVRRILEKAFGRVKSANYRTIILAHEDIK